MRSMYMVYDVKSRSTVGGIILESRDAPAIRAFHDALQPKNNTVLSEHPEDFQLLCVGVVDEQGQVIAAQEPAVIANGAQWAAATAIS